MEGGEPPGFGGLEGREEWWWKMALSEKETMMSPRRMLGDGTAIVWWGE